MTGVNSFEVEGGGRKMRVIIPKSGDKAYDNYLVQAETEKTKKELESKPKVVSTVSRKETSVRLKEYTEFKNRQKSEHPRKYW